MLVVHLIIITYIVLSEDVFGQGMVVLLNPVCLTFWNASCLYEQTQDLMTSTCRFSCGIFLRSSLFKKLTLLQKQASIKACFDSVLFKNYCLHSIPTYYPQTGCKTKWWCFWCYFWDFVGVQKIKDWTFHRIVTNNKKIHFRKKTIFWSGALIACNRISVYQGSALYQGLKA